MKNASDYIELRKSIARYIDKYPSATKEDNKRRLQKLEKLKPFLSTSPEARKEYKEIRDKIAISNGGFAMTYVMKYSNIMNDSTPITELFQEATIGIIESIDTFDLDKNTSFTTYAFYHVRKRLIDYIKKNKLIRAPRHIARNIKHVNEAQEILTSRLAKNPTAYDIKKQLKLYKGIELDEKTIDNILILLELNSEGYEDSFVSEYVDQLSCEDNESSLFRSLELNILSSLQRYSERERKLIKMRFGIGEEYPHTLEEIKLMMETDNDELKKIKGS